MMRVEHSCFEMPDIGSLSFSVIPGRSPAFKGHPNIGQGIKALKSSCRGHVKVDGWLYQIVDNAYVLRYAIVYGQVVEVQ